MRSRWLTSVLLPLLTLLLACTLSTPAVAATCTDNFTGANEGQWSVAANWSAGVPGTTAVACWPSNITVLISSPIEYGATAASIQGGGLTIDTRSALYFLNSTGESSLSGTLTQTDLGYLRGPQKLSVGGEILWSSGQISTEIALKQGPGSSLTIGPGETQAYLDYGSSITTASPVTISNPNFLTAGTSLTTSSTITLADGLDLSTGGGNNGTFTAAGIGPNASPVYGFGADSLILTGGTTTVPAGSTLESGPLSVQGGVLQDDGTVGTSTYGGTDTLAPTTLTGGVLDGTGRVAGSLTNSGGMVSPGDPAGQLTVTGDYTQEGGGTLAIGLAGTAPGTGFDQLLVEGGVTLGGTLALTDEGGFTPAFGDSFKIISGASSRQGTFTSLTGASASLYGVEYNPDGATLTTNPVYTPVSETPAVVSNGVPATTSIGSGQGAGDVATTPQAIEDVLLGCTNTTLVLNDVYVRGDRVLLSGSAAKRFIGKQVKILLNDGREVAHAKVEANGQFTTTAPLPPGKSRESLSTRYRAEVGKLRSLNLKLTRRLVLEAPKAEGTTVTLTGYVTEPLTKPIAPVVVEQQLQCGASTVVKSVTPAADGRFHITVTVPAGARAAIYRLKSAVAANAHSTAHGFATFSLPLPVVLG
jgi:hypothetical protein